MKIPEEAVEAAARAVFLNGYPKGCGVSWDPESPIAQGIKRDVTIALEAATPYMQAEIAAAKGTCNDALWHEFQAATQSVGTNPSVVIRGLVREWVDKNKEAALNDVNALPGTEWGTDHWGEIMSEPTEGHARGFARITGAKVYSRSPMGQWVEA